MVSTLNRTYITVISIIEEVHRLVSDRENLWHYNVAVGIMPGIICIKPKTYWKNPNVIVENWSPDKCPVNKAMQDDTTINSTHKATITVRIINPDGLFLGLI